MVDPLYPGRQGMSTFQSPELLSDTSHPHYALVTLMEHGAGVASCSPRHRTQLQVTRVNVGQAQHPIPAQAFLHSPGWSI